MLRNSVCIGTSQRRTWRNFRSLSVRKCSKQSAAHSFEDLERSYYDCPERPTCLCLHNILPETSRGLLHPVAPPGLSSAKTQFATHFPQYDMISCRSSLSRQIPSVHRIPLHYYIDTYIVYQLCLLLTLRVVKYYCFVISRSPRNPTDRTDFRVRL